MTSTLPNPGIAWAIGQIGKVFDRAEVKATRKPKARKLDQNYDEPPRCFYCKGDEEETCRCGGLGYDREQPSAIITVWRDFHGIEVQAVFDAKKTKVIDAYVVVTEGDFINGQSLELSWEEQQEALSCS